MISSFVVKIEIAKDRYLLINTKNGSIIRVDKDGLDAIQNETLDTTTEKALRSAGFIVDTPDNSKVEEYFKTLQESVYSDNYHIAVVTYTCNLNCSYCYLRNRRFGADLTYEQIDSMFQAILALDNGEIDGNKSKIRNIQLYGGEPLQKRLMDKIKYILEKGSEENYKFLLFTNAMDLNHYIPLLESYQDSILLIQTTIDGPKEIHDQYRYSGSFDRVISNIELAIESGFNVVLRTNVGKSNIRHIERLAKFYTEKGWVNIPNIHFYLAPLRGEYGPCYFNPELSYEEILSLFKSNIIKSVFEIFDGLFVKFKAGAWIPQFYNCPAHYRQFFYDPYGDIYSCMSALRIRELSIGKYHPHLEFNKNFDKYKSRTIFNIDKCKKCEYALICGGGCSYNAYLKTGDLSNPDCYSMEILKEKFFKLFNDDDVVKYYLEQSSRYF